MTSSGSSKDLAKALNGFFRAPILPLPAELVSVISSYLDRCGKVDESTSDRLNDDLLSLYEKSVQDHTDKYAPFLAVLRELRPAFRTPSRIFEWWNRLLDPMLDCVHKEKGLAREVLDHTLDLLLFDGGDEPAAWNEAGLTPFINRLLNKWMEARKTLGETKSYSADLRERLIKEALLIFGKKDPKVFMMCLDAFVVKRGYRNNALSLLNDFISSQPPHLHLILQTPLFSNILHSLQKDESTATIIQALMVLIMVMPYIPSSLVPFLPTLFNIYARLLFWDIDSYFAQEHTEIGAGRDGEKAGMVWEKCLLDPDHDGSSIYYLDIYFTVLYGLYPINFVDYIRKPQRYLRHANNDEDIGVQAMEIRDRSERFRKTHLLHPNFYNLTIESEKTEFSRWIKSEPDEVLADCMALRIEETAAPDSPSLTEPPPGLLAGQSLADEDDRDGLDHPLLGGSAYTNTTSPGDTSPFNPSQQSFPPKIGGGQESIKSGTRGSVSSHPSGRESLSAKQRELGGDSPTLPPQFIHTSSSQTRLQDIMQSNEAISTSIYQSGANDSVASLTLWPQEAAAENNSLQPPRFQPSRSSGEVSPRSGDQASLLYHQGLLLLNDLQFERYIKQQHITHMGELRRKQIREAATEAETQNLVMANRSLKQRLDEAKRQELQIKKEFEHRRNMAQKRENDLSSKLRNLREEQKKWSAEGAALRQELGRAQSECERLRRIVDDAEEKRLQSEQNLEAVDISTDEIERLKAEISRLSVVEHVFQGKELEMQKTMEQAAAATSRAEELRMDLAAREDQLQQARGQYESQIEALSGRLSEFVKENQGSRGSEVRTVFEHALAASRTKQAELQKQHNNLLRKYTALQSALLNMQCEIGERKVTDGGSSSYGADNEAVPMAGSPIAIRNRGQRVFSDPEIFDGVSHNATSPLEPVSTSLGSGARRPSTPPDGAAGSPGGSGKTSTSPQMERYFGRGGVQNAIRKERKEEKPDKKEKKEKKSAAGGLRGIRNLV